MLWTRLNHVLGHLSEHRFHRNFYYGIHTQCSCSVQTRIWKIVKHPRWVLLHLGDSFQPLTIFAKSSILQAGQISEYTFDVKPKSRGGSRITPTSKMEHFLIIVNGWKPLTIIAKSSILDDAAVLDPPLNLHPTYICITIISLICLQPS